MVHSEPIAQSWSVQNKSLQREAALSKMCNRSRPEPISQTGTQGRQMAKRSRCYRLTCAAYKLLQGSWPVCGSGPPELAARNDAAGVSLRPRPAPRGPALSLRPALSLHPALSLRGTKQSIAAFTRAHGLPRRCAPRNDAEEAALRPCPAIAVPARHCGPGPSSLRPRSVIAPPLCHCEERSNPQRPPHRPIDHHVPPRWGGCGPRFGSKSRVFPQAMDSKLV